MTNQNDLPKKELDELLERLANRELTSADNSQLAEQLASDASARQSYIRNSVFEAMLSYEFPSQEAVAAYQLESPKPSWLYRNMIGLVALAATILIGFWLGTNALLDRSQPQVSQETPANDLLLETQVATVTNVSNAIGFHSGQRLLTGPVELLTGELELTLDCGAVVSLVGPAKLDLQSDYRAFLHFGGLSAHVPQEAVGFIVQTPNSHIRDLGTSFTIKVAKNGDTDLHVIEGAVEATSVRVPRATPTVVSETQAVRFVGSTVEPLRYEADSYSPPKQGDQIERRANYVHWSFDRIGEDTDSNGTIVAPLRLKRLNSTDAIPTTASGVIGNSLNFDGMGGYAESTYRGIEGDGARTVAFWIRLPDLSHEGNRNCIISWGLPVPSKKWEIIWNRSASLGTVGAVRVDFGKGRVVGSTDLRDSLWHHVAIVFHGGRGANLSTHVKLYVDGRLETVTGRLQQQISTDTSTPGAVPVTLGRFIDSRSKVLTSYFIGELDELFIVDDAMTPSQIVRLKESNRIQPKQDNRRKPSKEELQSAVIKALPDFRVETIYEVPLTTQGSWVSLTIDPKGRLIASDQGKEGLYRITITAPKSPKVEKLPVELSSAQGLVWKGDALYASVTDSGIYRVTDSNGDDLLDRAELLSELNGKGEHGNHALFDTRDNHELFAVAGNHTPLPATQMSSRTRVQSYAEDLLLPRQWDARGHAAGILAPGGWFTRFDLQKKTHELYCMGFRNQYDAAMNVQGDIFTYDSDMEWDLGLPWYCPTRIQAQNQRLTPQPQLHRTMRCLASQFFDEN